MSKSEESGHSTVPRLHTNITIHITPNPEFLPRTWGDLGWASPDILQTRNSQRLHCYTPWLLGAMCQPKKGSALANPCCLVHLVPLVNPSQHFKEQPVYLWFHNSELEGVTSFGCPNRITCLRLKKPPPRGLDFFFRPPKIGAVGGAERPLSSSSSSWCLMADRSAHSLGWVRKDAHTRWTPGSTDHASGGSRCSSVTGGTGGAQVGRNPMKGWGWNALDR